MLLNVRPKLIRLKKIIILECQSKSINIPATERRHTFNKMGNLKLFYLGVEKSCRIIYLCTREISKNSINFVIWSK